MKILFLFVALFVVSSCTSHTLVTIKNIEISVEVMDTPPLREQGLTRRIELESNTGALFIFEEEAPVTFWMKNTLIPLDIIYLSGAGEITQIETAAPCAEDPCTYYPSYEPTKYVLEGNQGVSKENNILVGDVAEIIL